MQWGGVGLGPLWQDLQTTPPELATLAPFQVSVEPDQEEGEAAQIQRPIFLTKGPHAQPPKAPTLPHPTPPPAALKPEWELKKKEVWRYSPGVFYFPRGARLLLAQ